MMDKKEIGNIVDAPPLKRAAMYLAMGAEMGKRKRKPPGKGEVPKSLRREAVARQPIGQVLMQMHGDISAVVDDFRGLKPTGMQLQTAGGKIEELVCNRFSRKEAANRAMSSEKDRSAGDLMVRQLAIGMLDSSPHARITAAYAYWQATGASHVVAPVLENATLSEDEDEQMLAAVALAQVDAKKVKHMQGVAADDKPQGSAKKSTESMTVIIHGTFAKNAKWYQPGGDFHSYIKSKVYPDTYSGKDFYYWSGRYSRNDTTLKNIWRQAAKKLVAWCKAHPTKKLRLIAHSHGNNVVNLASQMGLPSCTLIQLSVPVRDWNLPDMSTVSSDRLFNIHSTIDLVVAIDGGAQDYRGTSVAASERRRIIAFSGHSASHDKKKWRKKKTPKFVKTVCP